ncbi:MAG: rRNA maturation RNase YbeY [Candidatus Liptonbacteria bacterium]
MQRVLKKIFKELRAMKLVRGDADPEVEVELLLNDELKKLKKEYLKKDAETVDVLSFPNKNFPVPGKKQYLGEIYLNREIVNRDPSRGIFLLLHGVLHLIGYRHDNKHDTIVMERLEQEIIHALGSE